MSAPNPPEHGIELRDWLAGMAMHALITQKLLADDRGSLHASGEKSGDKEISVRAYQYADAMMKRRQANLGS